MHPNANYHAHGDGMEEWLLDPIGFGMVFLTTPEGPRVAHTPILRARQDTVQFHLARNNALAPHLDGSKALLVVNGPDAYVSPRWYDNRTTVPTWDYVALELEGQVRRMSDEGLDALLHTLIERSEARIPGAPFVAEETPADIWAKLFRGIAGFEMTVEERRSTVKLSQKKAPHERARIAGGLDQADHREIASLYRAMPA
ncbi:FMN-binding negative transcriptional regulator [Aurantiacibacter zhengii]|uniref:FMN-binding negative transcriptional regulator n=1 Tax=Aurantiacibacter zhengii TaxID=2307003 RepID=A0A418NVB3_9SPHN|nr:FMN-binding negative transcriptional regulator [Aurantiacibacter zhengii]RIV87918.1 FMN-binding negative transcriptional regulator [Aurantiacibacter zhengii]